jgi:hypothetical protein
VSEAARRKAETTAEISPAQQELEALLAVSNRLNSTAARLKVALGQIGGQKQPASAVRARAHDRPANISTDRAQTRFFPALQAIRGRLEEITAEIETDIEELARRF